MWPGVGAGGGSSENEDDEKLWLEWNSTTTQRIVEFSKKLFENKEYGERTVAGVELNNNTALQHKANDETDDVTTCRIFEKKLLFENEEYGETVAGVISTTTQQRDPNGEEKTTEKTTTGESLEPS